MTEFQPQASSYVPQQASREPAAPQQPQHPQAPVASQWMEPTQAPAEPTFLVAQVPGQGAGPSHAAPGAYPAPAGYPAPPAQSSPSVYPAPTAYPAPGTYPAAPPQPSYTAPTYQQPAYAPPSAASEPAAYGAGQMWAPAYAPAKKRKVWPWVVGGVGLLVVLAGAAIGGIVWLGNTATNSANPDYSAATIGDGDKAAPGSTMFVGASGKFALEIPDEWVNVTADVAPLMGDPDVDGFENVGFEAWTDGDPTAGYATTLIMVLDTEGPLILEGDVPEFHDGFVKGAGGTLTATEFSVQPNVTTSHGLEVSYSHGDAVINGTPATLEVHTAGRGNHMITVMVIDYIGTGVNYPEVVDTLRIDK